MSKLHRGRYRLPERRREAWECVGRQDLVQKHNFFAAPRPSMPTVAEVAKVLSRQDFQNSKLLRAYTSTTQFGWFIDPPEDVFSI